MSATNHDAVERQHNNRKNLRNFVPIQRVMEAADAVAAIAIREDADSSLMEHNHTIASFNCHQLLLFVDFYTCRIACLTFIRVETRNTTINKFERIRYQGKEVFHLPMSY